jgi:flagellar secretion chaperone FliS
MSKNAMKAYASATQTVPPTRQVVMLYEATIRCLQQAKEAMERRDILERYKLLTRAGEIIFGLQGALDFERGEEVAKTLYNFYSSVDARILSLHRRDQPETYDQLIADLKMMRDSWVEIDANQHGAVTAPPAAAEPLPHDPVNGSAGLSVSV